MRYRRPEPAEWFLLRSLSCDDSAAENNATTDGRTAAEASEGMGREYGSPEDII